MGSKVGWIGLGVMGYPMAGFLARAGHDVTVFNRTASRAQKWASEYAGAVADSPSVAARDADFVFCCVGNDADLRTVTTGASGAFETLRAGAVFVDHTTTSAVVARELAELAVSRGAAFLDAPVSGGQSGAENGALTCMVGGHEDVFERARPLMDCYSKMLARLGPSGYGQLTKMVNQICIAGLVQGLAEGLHFAKANDLDGEAVLQVISKGAAQSWQMDNRGSTMLKNQFDFGFAVDWMRKDLGIVLEQAAVTNASLPVTKMVDEFYANVQQLGGRRWDTSSLIVPLEKQRTEC